MAAIETVLCPRCERNRYTPYGEPYNPEAPPPALSRADNDTYICSDCGTAEAMAQFQYGLVVPINEWPVKTSGTHGQGRT